MPRTRASSRTSGEWDTPLKFKELVQGNASQAPANPALAAANGETASGCESADADASVGLSPGSANVGTAQVAGPSSAADETAGSAAAAAASATARSTTAGPDPATVSVSIPAEVVSESDFDDLFDKVRAVTDNRIVATLALALLLIALDGLQSPVTFAVLLFAGYVLLDHFVSVRRIFTLGGLTWAVIVFLGDFILDRSEPMMVSTEYFFVFFGFLLALAVCGVYFIGRALYYYGYNRGQKHADHAIAQHITDRLVDNPDEWSEIDGDFLEVEAAINRAREQQRSAEQALKDESDRKDDLVTYLAHDLKTPLASVVGYLSLLDEAPDLPVSQRKRFTRIALEKAHRLDELIEEFFDITRFDFHDIVLTRSYLDLGLLLAQVVDEFYPTLREQGKNVEISVPEPITLLVDGDKMARVFNNVMKNAIAYSYDGSTIRVSGVRENGAVVIRFENQGDPIPEAKLNLIFEKFYRLDSARATNHGGAGLGLAIAREIVTAHGGTIVCESDPEATVFVITLPEG